MGSSKSKIDSPVPQTQLSIQVFDKAGKFCPGESRKKASEFQEAIERDTALFCAWKRKSPEDGQWTGF